MDDELIGKENILLPIDVEQCERMIVQKKGEIVKNCKTIRETQYAHYSATALNLWVKCRKRKD
jgi:hypothetical protein